MRTYSLGQKRTKIEIGDTTPLPRFLGAIENSPGHYLNILEYDKISMLLFDASVVQLSYTLKQGKIIHHRYCYIPAPCAVDLRVTDPKDLFDLVIGAIESNALNEPRRAVLRFEYEPAVRTVEHPAAHLHVNSNECRLPLKAPLGVKDFMHFIIRFMYSDHFVGSAVVADIHHEATLSDDEEQGFHLNWRLRIGPHPQ